MSQTSRPSLAYLLVILLASVAAAQEPASVSNSSESRIITGRVVSDSGQPLAGASVFASISTGPSNQRTATDSEGNFKLQGLDAGLYRLSASLPGYVFQSYQTDLNNVNAFYRPGESASLTLIKGGVIAGTITSIEGQPVVSVSVRAFRVRDGEGNKVPSATFSQPRMSDDRGYFRIYGLLPGTYLVSAGGPGQYFGSPNPYANDAPTYAPASTRDTAAEFIVHSDQEVTADIRYRGEPGHVVSGKISGALPATPPPPGGLGVRLSDLDSHAVIASAQITGDDRAFQLNGVSDGEYEIIALSASGAPNTDLSASPPRHLTVKGADVTGLVLTLAPLGSIAGRVVFETDPKLNCGRHRDNAQRETMVVVRRDRVEEQPGNQKPKDKTDQEVESVLFPRSVSSIPNERGEINFRNLTAANYRLEIRTPGAGWYVRDVNPGPSGPRAPANRAVANLARNGIGVKGGERISGVTIAIAEGGAGFRGRVTTAEGQSVPPGLRVYLVPAEREHNDNVLRFFEGTVAGDGTFAIGNIAPARYWLIALPAETIDANTWKSVKTDGAWRAKVLHGAEAAKKEISFKPCERNGDYELPYSP